MRKRIAAVLVILVVMLTACANGHNVQLQEASAIPSIMESSESSPTQVASSLPDWDSRWIVYWDLDFQEELAACQDSSEILCYFSCFFDDNGNIYFPEGFAELQEAAKDVPGVRYLSVTNDLIYQESGQTVQKDVGVLERILADEGTMADCVGKLLTAAQDYPGLEIDFENLKQKELWEQYSVFLGILSREAEKCDKKVRVVLQCSAPVDELALPENFSYSVMCYNLYGYHSGPGPKADIPFLKKTAKKFRNVPNISFALATGGFVWNESGAVSRALTYAQAEELRQAHAADAKRDQKSGALHFTYSEDGETFTVWYADTQTLSCWQETIDGVIGHHASYDFWRVGGNLPNEESFG